MAEGRIVEDEAELAAIVRGARTVAVVGMKDERDPDAPAHRIPRILVDHGLQITPVNPRIERALGVPAVKELAALPARVDVVDVFRRPDTLGALADAAAARLAAAGLTVVQDHCLGVYSRRYREKVS